MLGKERGAAGDGKGAALRAADAHEEVVETRHVADIERIASDPGVVGEGGEVHPQSAMEEMPVCEMGEEWKKGGLGEGKAGNGMQGAEAGVGGPT